MSWGLARVVLAEILGSSSGELADPTLVRAVTRGSPAVPLDDDGLVRRASCAGMRGPRLALHGFTTLSETMKGEARNSCRVRRPAVGAPR